MARCALVVLALQQAALAPITIRPQVDGVNSLRVVTVAASCRGPGPCTGVAKLTRSGKTLGRAPFSGAGKTTFKTPIKLSASVFRTLHKASGRRMHATLTLTPAGGAPVSHVVTIKL